MGNDDMSIGKSLLIIAGCIIFFISIWGILCAIIENDDSSTTSTEIYSNYHKCEYPGCDNYASKTKYCSIHNQTKCSRAGCRNKEAYQGAGLCREHLYQSIQNY